MNTIRSSLLKHHHRLLLPSLTPSPCLRFSTLVPRSSTTTPFSKLLQTPPRSSSTVFNNNNNNNNLRKMATSTTTPLVSLAKQSAAYAAVDAHFQPLTLTTPPQPPPGSLPTYIGIGSGSTVVHVVNRIASLKPQGFVFIPTGFQSRQLILSAGLPLSDLDGLPDGTTISVCFDGADECDPSLNLIKGGGACMLQEKLVAVNTHKFIMVADISKKSPGLCTTSVWKTGIPVEVIPNSYRYVSNQLKEELNATTVVLRGGGAAKAGPCVTDNGCFILDCLWSKPLDSDGDAVQTLAEGIKKITGVVEHGLFYSGSNGRVGRPVVAYFGDDQGNVTVVEEKVDHASSKR